MFSIVLLCCVTSLFMISNKVFVSELPVAGNDVVVNVNSIVALHYFLYLSNSIYPHLLLSYTSPSPNSTFPFQFAT